MIVGSGNDRPTPRIVPDFLGADPNLDPEPLSFVSLGEGAARYGQGILWIVRMRWSRCTVPCVVKIEKPTECTCPGNRGKRDSQMLHFRNKVCFSYFVFFVFFFCFHLQTYFTSSLQFVNELVGA
jgi:chitin synthase